MKIKKTTSQSRRDFYCIYQCEACGHEEEGGGYDDANFHQNVIPSMLCPECGEKAPKDAKPRDPKYPADYIV